MSRLLVIALPILTSCGSLPESNRFAPRNIPRANQQTPDLPDDVDVKLLVGEFYANAQSLGVAVARDVKSVTFVEGYDKDITVGQCEFESYEGKTASKKLTLKKSSWDAGSAQFKRTLIFHELGHCALNLDHAPSGSNSIMNPWVIDDYLAASTWLDLVKEMFATAPSLGLQGISTVCGE